MRQSAYGQPWWSTNAGLSLSPTAHIPAPIPAQMLVRFSEANEYSFMVASLPLNRPRRLTRHIIDHTIDALHLVDDARRHRADEFHVERIKIRSHAVGRGHRA